MGGNNAGGLFLSFLHCRLDKRIEAKKKSMRYFSFIARGLIL
jgi:hypothetical protein